MDREKSLEILRKNFGHSSFRSNQFEIINSIVSGIDSIALLPTGGGKSICYQLPVIYLRSKALIITPLIALMDDQVNSLVEKSIPAYALHSGMDSQLRAQQMKAFDSAPFGLLYVSPERLNLSEFKASIDCIPLSHIAIDEAHCISQWGHDFRPSYLRISEFIEGLKQKPQVCAFTATATEQTLVDIKQYGGLEGAVIFKNEYARKNIEILIKKITSIDNVIKDGVISASQSSQIIYTRSRRKVKEISEKITYAGHKAKYYHGNLSMSARDTISKMWRNDEITSIVATNAFGMGIDKSDVRQVFHLDIPPSIEEYYQEIGRAGRDGLPSVAIMLLDKGAVTNIRKNLEREFVTEMGWNKFNEGVRAQMADLGNKTIDPFVVRDFAKEVDMHPFQVVKCLDIYSKEGSLYASEGIFEPSRVMLNAAKSKESEYFRLKEDRYIIADHLLKNYEHLFDHHAVIVEEQIGKALNLSWQEVTMALHQLQKENILSYQERKEKPFIRLVPPQLPAIPFSIIKEGQVNKLRKMEAIIEYIESERCRMQVLMEYFNEAIEPCNNCDNCKDKYQDKNLVSNYINNIISMKTGSSVNLRNDLFHVQPDIKGKILSKLKLLENEGIVSIKNGILHIIKSK